MVRGATLIHPLVLGAMALMAINDHLLKDCCHSWLTGKLSDFAGLLFFPILLHALGELLFTKEPWAAERSNKILGGLSVITAVGFSWVQLSSTGGQAWAMGLGGLQWIVTGGFLRDVPVQAVQHWADPTDLMALPMLGVALWIGWRRG
jgi:hypothetical protein